MMKNNKNDSEIFVQIKESLQNYEEAYIPGSWENFLQKRKDNKRKIFLRIASGIAACLLVGFLGINYLQFDTRDKSDTTAELSNKTFIAKPDVENDFVKKSPSSEMAAKSGSKQPDHVGEKIADFSVRKKILTTEVNEKTTSDQLVPGLASTQTDKVPALQADTKPQPIINKTDTEKSSSDTIKGKTKNTFLISPQTEDNQHLASTQKRKIRFGINFSPGVNTTESSGSLNYMGGVSADISLSSKVALSTGLQVENQSFVKYMPGIVSSSTVPLNQTKTKMTNLDLPVNITWKFAAEKSHAYYVSAGLSSLVYLKQENKNTTYSQDLIPVSSLVNGEEVKSYNIVNQVSVTQNAVTPPQTFDFAGRINFMVGYEKKLSDRIYIHVEPYTKIPTSSQAAGSLNHTTTGINFKISF